MAAYGIATYDANGNYNNYGIKPVTVVAVVKLETGQTSGSYSYTIPSGTKLGYTVSLSVGGNEAARKITASGNAITISATTTPGDGVYPAEECYLVIYLENQ
ncbi:hypothetical protein Sf12_gp38 [Shigella phage Sf12]|uniref:Uncharacterized protein n=1 Tax=Shigella phage Sf12 TaxID=2024315 RepID=A0A291AXM8_9CAUD|nr:outer membrane protein [Shigella phage Sf12]ATE85764.1 hypothetical protein Sf12_gp38 [Shigella phage Sf12]